MVENAGKDDDWREFIDSDQTVQEDSSAYVPPAPVQNPVPLQKIFTVQWQRDSRTICREMMNIQTCDHTRAIRAQLCYELIPPFRKARTKKSRRFLQNT
jgi:hypothetical protein